MKIEYPEKKKITKEMLPQIVERIFAICKTDSNFPLKKKMTNVDNNLLKIQENINIQAAMSRCGTSSDPNKCKVKLTQQIKHLQTKI